ncbi:MAG: PGF-pre-PGF domain-containing protein, partial [Methanosarcinaceae archaeon]|nr:PGF-pre-PGF domain-containing protein [Methanosarcinaceae archaeon]
MKNAIYIFLILLLVSIFANASTASECLETDQDNAILLKNAVFDTSKQSVVPVNAELATTQYSTDTEKYYILQFKGNVLEEWKQAVKNTGAVFFDYVPNNAFIVRMNSSVKSQVETMDVVQWIGSYQPAYKISPVFSASSISATTTTTINLDDDVSEIIVMLFDSKHNAQVTSKIKELGGEIVDNSGDIMRVRIGTSKLSDIADMNGVSWIEKYVQPVIFNDIAANITNVSYVQNTHGLTGSGQIVAVADTGLDTGANDGTMHDDIEGKIFSLHAWWAEDGDNGSADFNGHGTHVAGSVLGNGSRSSGQYSGMAPMAQLVFQALQYDGSNPAYNGYFLVPVNLSLLFQEAYDDGAKIHSNSWGSNNYSYYGNYTSSSQYVDRFMWDNKDMLIVFAAGNYGSGQNTVSPPSTAKNALTVGASESSRDGNINFIASFSSRGPTDDGRIKPDVVAPGTAVISTASSLVTVNDYESMSGTSMATPITAGTAALVRQYYVDNESISPSAALIKATLINGATNMSLSTNDQGWGRVDIEKSLFPTSTRTMRYHDNISLITSKSWNMSYDVNNSLEPLEITLVWTDYPGNPAVIPQLVNNLDLNVIGPDGSYLGNGGDSINNVERVEIVSPSVGLYTVYVNGTNVLYEQPFALVISWGIDVYPPSISGEFPGNNSYTNNNTTSVSINITDSGVGVNFSSIEMSVNDNPIIFANTAIAGGYMVYNQTVTPFTHTQVVNVTVNATDNNSNFMSYNWSFTIDGNASVLTDTAANPQTIESNGIETTNLSVNVTDDLSGISSVTINLSSIGGAANVDMQNSSGNYWINTNATGVGNGIYYLPINAIDNAGNSNKSVNITLYVNDTTAPTLSNNTPATCTNNITPTISINATDIGSGVNVSSANMTIDDVGVLLANTNSAFTYNFSNTITIPYNHGDTVNVTFNVSDNEGHTSNYSWKFYIDNVTPIISITSPADGYSTTASSITILGAVNGTGSQPVVTVNSISASTTLTNFSGTFTASVPISLGANTIYANVTDAAGNINSTSISVTRTSPASPSSSSGGGGGGTSGEEYENIEFKDVSRVYISANTDVSFTFSKTGNDIQSINYKALTSAGYISATVEVLKNTSALVKQPPSGTVYKNMNIWLGKAGYATDHNIENPVIGFRVKRSWIQDNRIDENSIKLNRYSQDVWSALPTTRTGEDATYIYFESQTPGFSPFAITAQEKTISSQVSIKSDTVTESLQQVEETPVEKTTTIPTPEIESVEETSIWGNF